MKVPLDDCMHCGKQYSMTKENAVMQLFIKDVEHNFIYAKCPHCGCTTRIYIGIETTCSLLECLPIRVLPEPPDEIRAGYLKANPDKLTTQTVVVEPSQDDINRLMRDLEAFEHGIDG